MISLKACSAAEGSPTATNNCSEQRSVWSRTTAGHVFSHLNQLCFLLRTAAEHFHSSGRKKNLEDLN